MMRILIAEDEQTSRQILTMLLEKWGYEVMATADGNEAWAELQRDDAPQLAILDWLMPGLDGIEVIQKVRASERSDDTYLLLLTGMTEQEDVVRGLQSGADDYVTKPYDRAELKARLGVGARVIQLRNALHTRVSELQKALDHIKTLQGIIPICMHCHKIRNDEESWQRIETYIEHHSEAEFSHGLCPECLEKYYPEDDEEESESTA